MLPKDLTSTTTCIALTIPLLPPTDQAHFTTSTSRTTIKASSPDPPPHMHSQRHRPPQQHRRIVRMVTQSQSFHRTSPFHHQPPQLPPKRLLRRRHLLATLRVRLLLSPPPPSTTAPRCLHRQSVGSAVNPSSRSSTTTTTTPLCPSTPSWSRIQVTNPLGSSRITCRSLERSTPCSISYPNPARPTSYHGARMAGPSASTSPRNSPSF
mmetsp:Transcript_20425/g.58607  ORF Transcript_20425/g.58607 Transcript_20425/m.58607 type:complete len:209 (-) Transcript_20425:1851-2477(-)